MSESNKTIKMSELNEDSLQALFFSMTSVSETGYWETLCEQLNLNIKKLSEDYIWQQDEFKICPPRLYSDTDDGLPKHLISTTCFGDNIEDEWYIVYLVMELSKCYNDLIIQIIDCDGDFLLIEAANHLPSWANPESTENRVFIFHGEVHIIPPNLAELKKELIVKDALQKIMQFPEQTKASADVQSAILKRVGQYPQKMEENFHRSVVKLPLDIAALLTFQPSLIAPIVTSYCNQDINDAKACKNQEYTDYIPVRIKFTKCLYAMLMHSKLIRKVDNSIQLTESDKSNILGFKLTSGFQMIMQMLTKDVFCMKEYVRFENNLKEHGYFRGNIEGSSEYNQLLEKAKKYFLELECPRNVYLSEIISNTLTTETFLKFKEKFKSRKISDNDLTDDSDDWLNIGPNELNDLLTNRYGKQVKFNTDEVITPETITSKLTHFLKQSSDFEGVDNKEEISDAKSECIQFEADQFKNCLEKIMNLLSSDTNGIDINDDSEIDSDISADDYGDDELDKELIEKLNFFDGNRSKSDVVVSNLTQSMKEEGTTGPSSNIFTSIGINKTDLLDSDDD